MRALAVLVERAGTRLFPNRENLTTMRTQIHHLAEEKEAANVRGDALAPTSKDVNVTYA